MSKWSDKKNGIGSCPFKMKWLLSILWSGFKINVSNCIQDFTLFKFLKDVPTLTSYTPLDTSILNPDLSFEMDNIHEMKISYSKKKNVCSICFFQSRNVCNISYKIASLTSTFFLSSFVRGFWKMLYILFGFA
jgi:hypothetical protein